MAVKASRYLTHVRRLRDPAEPVARLLGAAAGLGPKLGPVLLQLPPTLKADVNALDACLREFRTAAAALGRHGLRVAVEPRHETGGPRRPGRSWPPTTPRCAGLTGAAARSRRCGAPRPGAICGSTRERRSRGPSYGPQALRSWVTRLTEAWPDEADVYVYFNNDHGGAAVINSAQFADLAQRAGRSVTRTPESADRRPTRPIGR